MAEAVILEAVRTPFGRRDGILRNIRPDKLLAHTLVGRAGMDPESGEVIRLDGVIHMGPR